MQDTVYLVIQGICVRNVYTKSGNIKSNRLKHIAKQGGANHIQLLLLADHIVSIGTGSNK